MEIPIFQIKGFPAKCALGVQRFREIDSKVSLLAESASGPSKSPK